MNIAVIGTGWLGHPLATFLNSSGHVVYGSRRSAGSGENVDYKPFIYPSANPLNTEILQKADIVVLAFPPDRSTSEAYANDCLEICQRVSGSCHVILTSSTSVYPPENGTCTETDLNDLSFSENPIARAEYELAQKLGKRLTIVRLAGLIGPGRYPVKSMSQSGKTYKGNEPVNVIHQTDAVNLITFVIDNNIKGEIINGSAGEHPSREAYYSWMAPHVGVNSPVFETNSGSTEGKIISSEKSRSLGYEYTYDNPFDFLDGV